MEKIDPSQIEEVHEDIGAPQKEKIDPSMIEEEHGSAIHVLSHPDPVHLPSREPVKLEPEPGGKEEHVGMVVNPSTGKYEVDKNAIEGPPPENPNDPSQNANVFGGVQKLLHPVGKAAGNVAGAIASAVESPNSSLAEKARHQLAVRTPLAAVFGHSAFAGMDPKEENLARQSLESAYGAGGATALDMSGQMLPMFLFGTGGEEGLSALQRLWKSAKTGFEFGLGQSLFNPEENPLESGAKQAAVAGALHFPLEAGAKGLGKVATAVAEAATARPAKPLVLGWMSPTFRQQVERELEQVGIQPGKPIPPDLLKWLNEHIGLAEERMQKGGYVSATSGKVQEPNQFVVEGSKEDIKGQKESLANFKKYGIKAGPQEDPFQTIGKEAFREGLPSPPSEEKPPTTQIGKRAARNQPTDVVTPGPAIAILDNDTLHIAPVAQRPPKSSYATLEYGDPVVLPDGLKATMEDETKDGKCVVCLPDGTRKTIDPSLIGHSPDGAVLPSGLHDDTFVKPQPSLESLADFYKGVPNPSIQDFKAFFGVSDAEAATIKALNPPPAYEKTVAGKRPEPYDGVPPVPPDKAPPSSPMPPSGQPPQWGPSDDANLAIVNNPSSRSTMDKYFKSVGGVGFNMNVPEAINLRAAQLDASQKLQSARQDWLAAANRLAPGLVGNPSFERAVADYIQGKQVGPALMMAKPEFWKLIGESANQLQRNHQLLTGDEAGTYLSMQYLRRADPTRWAKLVPKTLAEPALQEMEKKWGVTRQQSWGILQNMLGTDDLNEGIALAKKFAGGALKSIKLKDMPALQAVLGPAATTLRVAHSLAAQETIKYTRALLNVVKRDPNVFSTNPLSRSKGFVPVPDNIGMWLGDSSMDEGFWHRDLNDAFQNPGAMKYAAWEHSGLANRAMGVARWLKTNLIFSPTTFLKHVDQMRFGTMAAGGMSWLHPLQAGKDLLAAHKAIEAFKFNPVFSNPDAQALVRAKVNGAMGQNHAAYEARDRVVDAVFNNLESKWTSGPPTLHAFYNAALDAVGKNGGLAGKAAQMFYQGMQDRVQLANFIGLERRFVGSPNASELAGRRVAMSFPDASNTGGLAQASRSNPISGNLFQFATPVFENIRINSLIPWRIANGEHDLATRMLSHHIVNLLSFGTAGYGARQRLLGATAGTALAGGALGLIRSLNGISDSEVDAALAGQGKAGQSYPFALATMIPNDKGEPQLYNHANGSFAMELLNGVPNQNAWYSKASKVLTNGLGMINPGMEWLTEKGALRLGLIDDDGYSSPRPFQPGHPFRAALETANSFGITPFASMVRHLGTEYNEMHPMSIRKQAPSTASAIASGVFGRGFALPESRGMAAPVTDIRQASHDSYKKRLQIARDPSLTPQERIEEIRKTQEELKQILNKASQKAATISGGSR